jgi:hypothetical protein
LGRGETETTTKGAFDAGPSHARWSTELRKVLGFRIPTSLNATDVRLHSTSDFSALAIAPCAVPVPPPLLHHITSSTPSTPPHPDTTPLPRSRQQSHNAPAPSPIKHPAHINAPNHTRFTPAAAVRPLHARLRAATRR